MQEESFLQAILDDPDDDNVRLVYADWLEENGQPERGELIRVQIALVRLPDDDDRRAELAARERRLLLAHGKEWKDGVRGFFVRGFLERLNDWGGGWDPDEFAAQAPDICARHPIRELSLETPETPGWGKRVAACPQLSRLHTLRLQAAPSDYFSPPGQGSFEDTLELLRSPHLVNLRGLELSNGNYVEGELPLGLLEPDERLPALRNLQRLNLGYSEVTDATVQALVASRLVETLTHLDLSSNPITPVGLRVLHDSPLWSRLEALNLSGLHLLATPDYAALAEALGRSRLRRLNLTGLGARTNTSDALVRALVSAPSWGGLRSLNLDAADIELLAACPNLLGLTGLNQGSASSTGDQVRALANSRHARNLIALTIHLAPDVDEGLMALAASPFLSRLVYLEVWADGCSPASFTALMHSPNLRHLRVLQFFGMEGDEALKIVAASPYLGHLHSLYLSGGHGQVTGAGVNAVLGSGDLPHLSYLLPGVRLSADAVKAMLDARHSVVFWVNESDLTTEQLRKHYQARTDRDCGCDFFQESLRFSRLG
jgi:uncharacterized protein (TIGR02996 family)